MVASQADTTSIPLRIKDPRAGKSRLVTDCVVFSSEVSGIPGGGGQGIDEPLYLFERSFVTNPIDLEGTQSRPLCGGGLSGHESEQEEERCSGKTRLRECNRVY